MSAMGHLYRSGFLILKEIPILCVKYLILNLTCVEVRIIHCTRRIHSQHRRRSSKLRVKSLSSWNSWDQMDDKLISTPICLLIPSLIHSFSTALLPILTFCRIKESSSSDTSSKTKNYFVLRVKSLNHLFLGFRVIH